MLLGQNWR